MRPARAPFTFAFALAAALVVTARPARAEPAAYELSYSAAAGCPKESEVVAEVRANVHDAASGEGARIELTIVEQGGAFLGELVAFDRAGKQGRRTIQGPTCLDVAKALAFLAALAIELGGRIEAEPDSAPDVAAAAEPPRNPPKLPPRSQRHRSPTSAQTWQLSALLGAAVRGALGPQPRPAAEASVDFGAPPTRLLAPTLRATVVGALSRISHPDGIAELALLAGRFQGCPVRLGSRAVAVRPCLGFELGAVFASGELEGGRSVVKRWGSSEASLRLEMWLAPQVFLEVEAAAMVPWFRTHYFFVPDRSVFVVPMLTERAAIVTGFRFR